MLVRYDGSEDSRVIPALGVTVARGEVFECPADVAGRAPSPRWLELQLVDIPAAVAALDHHLRCRLIDELIAEDAGDGLLAQWPWFVEVEAPRRGKGGES